MNLEDLEKVCDRIGLTVSFYKNTRYKIYYNGEYILKIGFNTYLEVVVNLHFSESYMFYFEDGFNISLEQYIMVILNLFKERIIFKDDFEKYKIVTKKLRILYHDFNNVETFSTLKSEYRRINLSKLLI